MNQITNKNFGLLIAYLLPGLAALWSASYFSLTLRTWLAAGPTNTPTIGGFLYVTLASIAAGMTVSAVRFHIIDRIHHATGIRQSRWDFKHFQTNVTGYELLTEIHYKYYLFHSNMVVALTFSAFARHVALPNLRFGWFDVGFLLLAIVYFATSRDNLRRYYKRLDMLLSRSASTPDKRGNRIKNRFEQLPRGHPPL